MFLSETVCVAIFVLFVLGLPFSPRWLAEKGKFDKAKEVLAMVDGPEHAEREIVEIKTGLEQQTGSWSDLFGPGLRYALLIGVFLAFFNNWTGWSVIAGYIPRLFELSGFDRESAIGNFVAVYGAMGLMTLVSLLLLDRVGRRPLWIFASLAMALITGVTGYLLLSRGHGLAGTDHSCSRDRSPRSCPGRFALADDVGAVSHQPEG